MPGGLAAALALLPVNRVQFLIILEQLMLRSSCTASKLSFRKYFTVWFLALEWTLGHLWNIPPAKKELSPLTNKPKL